MGDTSVDRRSCPICAEPQPGDTIRPADCRWCGWTVSGVLRLGPAGASARSTFETALGQRQRAYDLAAAARAAGHLDADATAGYGRLAVNARPAGPDPETEMTVDSVAPEPATVAIPDVAAKLRETEAHSRLSVLEINVRGLTLWTARRDPDVLDFTWSADWPGLCDQVPKYPGKQMFQLAGGVGEIPVDRAVWHAAVQRAVTHVAGLVRHPLLLVEPPPGWVLLEHVARAAREQLAPAAVVPAQPGETELAALVHRLMTLVPRPEGYDVLLAQYDPHGRTLVARPRPVLPVEVVEPGRTRETTLVVHGTAAGETVVPVLRHGADPGEAAAVLVLPLTTGQRATITVRQPGPGVVELSHPTALPAAPAWGELAADLPALLATDTADPVDVVLAIELGGRRSDPGSTATRVAAARELTGWLRAHARGRWSLRVGVVGYGEHTHLGPEPRLDEHELGDPDRADAAIAELRGEPAQLDAAAPLEDALVAVARQPWRTEARKVVVTVASRPPYPPQQQSMLPRCPARLRLSDVVASLPAGAQVAPLVIGAGPAPGSWAEQAWTQLSRHRPADSGPAGIALLSSLLLPAGPGRRLRLALADPLPR
ncbi:hypothetical protein KOI35_12830 [Actinoplanes bogorensis]|uniref:Uncharacterized protein n=1 Tax=Paractinoplanes bogorensis TaxID=1610840 RepID=A0ABS5YM32_9ACTN|nr:hypothetical protein [Actinoplanes bogorensis]MBU2664381.1 hypothetical protein [Actinoplanes bogorensis]